jgi:hypothetical protein
LLGTFANYAVIPLDPWRDDPEVSSNDEQPVNDESESEDTSSDEDVDDDDIESCVCDNCTQDADIPPKCCNSTPCLGEQDSGIEPFLLMFYVAVIISTKFVGTVSVQGYLCF